MIQFDTPATLDGFVIIDALLNAEVVVAPTDDAAAYRSVLPPFIDGNGNFWLAVSESQKALTQEVLNSLSS